MHGHFDVVQWLHENRGEGCTDGAMGFAATHGHFDIVLFLHASRSEGCARDSIVGSDTCIQNLEIVQWLYEKYPEAISVDRVIEYDVSYMPAVLTHALGPELALRTESLLPLMYMLE
ncbi:hypothetical protein Gpo141_00014343 [Globisporangium polare]